MRAFYGGLPIGLAAFIGLSLSRLDLTRAALTLLVLLYGSLALARIGGLWLDGGAQQTFNFYALLLEVVSVGLCFWALREGCRASKTSGAPAAPDSMWWV